MTDLPILDVTKVEEGIHACFVQVTCSFAREGRAWGKTVYFGKVNSNACAFQKALHRLRPWTGDEIPLCSVLLHVSYSVESGIVSAGGTATIRHPTGEPVRRYRFPRPPVDEQSNIVTFLGRRNRPARYPHRRGERAIDLLQERRSALIPPRSRARSTFATPELSLAPDGLHQTQRGLPHPSVFSHLLHLPSEG